MYLSSLLEFHIKNILRNTVYFDTFKHFVSNSESPTYKLPHAETTYSTRLGENSQSFKITNEEKHYLSWTSTYLLMFTSIVVVSLVIFFYHKQQRSKHSDCRKFLKLQIAKIHLQNLKL